MWPLRYLIIETKLRREKRIQRKKGQARANTQQTAVAASHALLPRDNLRGQERPSIRLEVRPMKGKATNASQMATGPKIARKSSPGHAQPANKQVIGRGAALSPEQEAGSPALKMTMLDDRDSPGILVAPHNEMSVSMEEPWLVLAGAGKKVYFLIDTGITYCLSFSH